MADFATNKESMILSMAAISSSSSSSSSTPSPAIDDDFDNACSICLEPFSFHDPASVTTCKHEYHLHCILEWSQRSKECPICWQSLALKDPISQKLLAAAETERNFRVKHASNNRTTHGFNDSHWSDDSDFSERMMQSLTIMITRARQARRDARHSPSPPDFTYPSRVSESSRHPNTPEECSSANGSSEGSSPIASGTLASLSESSSPINSSSDSTTTRNVPHSSRTHGSHSPQVSQRPRSLELLSFSDSIKSKFSAVSARYKDSITKGTQGFREKLVARNTSVKELRKGVQREMTASIAGVTRMIERLDLKAKRNTQTGEVLSYNGDSSNSVSKGKGVLDDIIANSLENNGIKSTGTSSISSHKGISREEVC